MLNTNRPTAQPKNATADQSGSGFGGGMREWGLFAQEPDGAYRLHHIQREPSKTV